jgi:protease IV
VEPVQPNNNPMPPAVPMGSVHNHYYPPQYPQATTREEKKKNSFIRSVFRTLGRGIIVLSLILNVYLLITVAGNLQQKVYREGDYRQKIVLIDLEGQIDMRTARDFREKLLRAQEDKYVQGVILVINSPGGYVPPTEMIHRYITDFKQQSGKKIIAVIEQVGASGAYWAATAADEIYAQPNSIVGSIGVLYVNMVLENALKEKLGIDPIVIKSSRSPFKDELSFLRHPTDVEIADVQKDLDRVHERFVKVVSEGRNIPTEQVWALADGKIHDGEESKEKKLVDKIGFLDDAIKDFADQLKLTDPQVVHYFNQPTLREMITAASSAADTQPFDIHRQLEKWAMTPKILALWPGQ